MNIKTKRGSLDNIVTYEHYCDTIDDLQQIPLEYTTLGSVAIVLQGQNNGFEVYMANSNHEWVSLGTGGSGGGSSGDGGMVFDAHYVDEDSRFVVDHASDIIDAYKAGTNCVIHFIADEASAGYSFDVDGYFSVTGYGEQSEQYNRSANFDFSESIRYYGAGITDWSIDENDKLIFNIYID